MAYIHHHSGYFHSHLNNGDNNGDGSSADGGDVDGAGGGDGGVDGEEEAHAAIFYSINSTQPGLRGVELGNFLIKRVRKGTVS